ncbi:MAG: DUF4856 domain-containing protein [Myxococcota bacterium]
MRFAAITLMITVFAFGCSDDSDGTGGTGGSGGSGGTGAAAGAGGAGGATGLVVPETYTFERDGVSTVAYTGQSTRQVLVSDMIEVMKTISDDVLGGQNLSNYDTAQKVYDRIAPLYDLGGEADTARPIPSLLPDGEATLQAIYADLNTANLFGKTAGNDAITDHKVWTDPGVFVGWDAANLATNANGDLGTVGSPEELIRAYLWTFAVQASDGANGTPPIDAATALYLTPDGLDLTQLLQKFVLGSVNFSQGVDDYLDDFDDPGTPDDDEKGLLKPNVIDGDPYTGLEHHWDEGYGYWGAARDYSQYTDDEIAGSSGRPEYALGYFDSNGDDLIDLESEFNFGASVNAAKRDRGSVAGAQTDFTADADLAWRTGRAIIAAAYDAGEEVDFVALNEQRDVIVMTWEKAIAATAIHYVNDVLGDMDSIGTPDYRFADHAKHWSELKGFALSLQFNPRSPLSDADFAAVHASIGDAPVGASPDSPFDDTDYRDALLEARTTLGEAYDFDDANVAAW